MYKIFIVMPVFDSLDGSEGAPKRMPSEVESSVWFYKDKAEKELLRRKENEPYIPWAIFESTHHAVESSPGVYAVAETVQY